MSDFLLNEMKKINIEVTPYQQEQLQKYYQLLIEKNKVMNLTAITEEKEVYIKHFYDSATLVKVIDTNKNLKICDLGTGAGFPGIVLKILFPNLEITLVDALQKRITFLNEVISTLNLVGIVAVHARMEEFIINHEEEYDIITARAVAKIPVLLELAARGIKIGGYFIAMKTDSTAELDDSKRALNILNFKITKISSFLLPIYEAQRSLICLQKQAKTNLKYPRRYSEIKKKPL